MEISKLSRITMIFSKNQYINKINLKGAPKTWKWSHFAESSNLIEGCFSKIFRNLSFADFQSGHAKYYFFLNILTFSKSKYHRLVYLFFRRNVRKLLPKCVQNSQKSGIGLSFFFLNLSHKTPCC